MLYRIRTDGFGTGSGGIGRDWAKSLNKEQFITNNQYRKLNDLSFPHLHESRLCEGRNPYSLRAVDSRLKEFTLTKVGMGAGMTIKVLGNYSAYQLFHHKETKYLLNKSWTRVDKFHQHFILHEYH